MKIDTGIPIPGNDSKFPLSIAKILNVGDSMWVAMTVKEARNAVKYAGKKLGHKYTIRKADDGARIWRAE